MVDSMKKLIILIAIIFSSCASKDGIRLHYYEDCNEYYDAAGVYHKECPNNIIDF